MTRGSAWRWPAVPDFLADTFRWRGGGYTLTQPSPVPLDTPAALLDSDPWIRVASVLEHVKCGDHVPVVSLQAGILNGTGDPVLHGACLDMTADAGAASDLGFLASTMLNSDVPNAMRTSTCHAARCAGEAWLVDYMVACHRLTERLADRESIAVYVSSLLEPPDGSLDLVENFADADTFEQMANSKLRTLLDELGTDQVVLFGGLVFDVHRVAWSLRRAVRDQDHGAVGMLRRKFEPYTGLDCSGFYENGRHVNFRGIRDVLDQFDAQNAARGDVFEPGKRFFFGHPVPR